ncbi:hypothetical protein Pint_31429 [Pistacia integerrima]|uniref:Uncharacterized protein n=1 Tax=Pistacia integerrima TaxID=434235 RepID=A0ACC0XP88_9ROSI|nr:hypothetical protein Pint_31429 [Pistacia integerrima]
MLGVFVQEKPFTCLYTESDIAFLIDSETFEQLEVPLDLFGKASAYLKDAAVPFCVFNYYFSLHVEGMKVSLELFDGRPLSARMPKRVTCTIKEIHVSTKGPTVTPRYQRAVLDNGVTVLVPSYLEIGEEIFINPEDDSYIGSNYLTSLGSPLLTKRHFIILDTAFPVGEVELVSGCVLKEMSQKSFA